MKTDIQFGDVFVMNFDGVKSEQKGIRPGVVFQNNTGNKNSPNIIALPITSSVKKMHMPTHVLIHKGDSGLKYDSVVLCENPQRMSKTSIGRYITSLSREYMKKIAAASLFASGAISMLDFDELIAVWETSFKLNKTVVGISNV